MNVTPHAEEMNQAIKDFKRWAERAFPERSWEHDGMGQVLHYDYPGMTLHQYYIGQALAGLSTQDLKSDDMVAYAFLYADKIMDEIEKRKEGCVIRLYSHHAPFSNPYLTPWI